MRTRAIPGLAVVAMTLGACGGETSEVVVSAEERGAARFADPGLGREGNVVACADCHATSIPPAPDGLPGADLVNVASRPTYWGGQEDDLLDAVNTCLFWFMGRSTPLQPEDPEGVDLYAYLASLDGDDGAPPRPFTIGDVEWPGEGDAARGGSIYDRSCAWCHGALHTGDGAESPAAPVLPDDTIAAHPLGDYTEEARRLVFVEKVRHGPFLGYGGTMPPFSLEVISDAELADLLTFMEVP